MYTTSRITIAGLLIVALATSASAESLDQAMSRLAGQVAREMRNGDVESIVVGRPDGPPGDAATAHMQRSLIEALRAEGVKVSSLASFKLSTSYFRTDGTARYAMDVKLRDKGGMSIAAFPANFEFVLSDPADRVVLEGSTVEPGTDANGQPQRATVTRIAESLAAESAPVLLDRAVAAHEKGKFRIEILAKDRDDLGPHLPRPMKIDAGRPVCDLRPGEVYAIRVVNDADHAVAVDLAIDGVNVWRLSDNEAWQRNGKLYVPAHGESTLYGWHLNGSTYGEFEVVDYPEALAQRLGVASPSSLGQVSALFYAAWKPDEKPPFAEPSGAAGPQTDVGRRIERAVKSQRCYFGTSLLGAITVRYDRPVR